MKTWVAKVQVRKGLANGSGAYEVTRAISTRSLNSRASRGRFRRRLRAPKSVSTPPCRRSLAMVSDPMYKGRFGSMKWNMIVGSMVLGATLCGQSFGGDLIHRLLGGRGVGASSSCCDTSVVDPSCGAEQAGFNATAWTDVSTDSAVTCTRITRRS